jgi:hypothetical protein
VLGDAVGLDGSTAGSVFEAPHPMPGRALLECPQTADGSCAWHCDGSRQPEGIAMLSSHNAAALACTFYPRWTASGPSPLRRRNEQGACWAGRRCGPWGRTTKASARSRTLALRFSSRCLSNIWINPTSQCKAVHCDVPDETLRCV